MIYNIDAINQAVLKHWPKNPNGTELYWWGNDRIFAGVDNPTWVLDGQTPVSPPYVVSRLVEKGEREADFLKP